MQRYAFLIASWISLKCIFMLNRQQLRQIIADKRKVISLEKQAQCAEALLEQVKNFLPFTQSKNVAFYIAAFGEIDPNPIMQLALEQNKNCYLPTIEFSINKQLNFIKHQTSDQLQKNHYLILEPQFDKNKIIPATKLDLVFTPLMGFDLEGHRLGMGAGYYDATFNFLLKSRRPTKPLLVGLAYDWQQIETLNAEAWDVPIDAIITEKNIYFVE